MKWFKVRIVQIKFLQEDFGRLIICIYRHHRKCVSMPFSGARLNCLPFISEPLRNSAGAGL